MLFYSTQSKEFWNELDTDGIVRSLTAKAHTMQPGWKQVESIPFPDGTTHTVIMTPEVTKRAYSIAKELFAERYPDEQLEELIWGYSVSKPPAGPQERTFEVPNDSPSLTFTEFWWNEVFSIVRIEENQGRPLGAHLAGFAGRYSITGCSTYLDLLRRFLHFDPAAWCDASQRGKYFHNDQPVMEIVVPYLKREWMVAQKP
jgi:hypothetical protein